MGRSGTPQAARGAAAIVLTDDDFGTVVNPHLVLGALASAAVVAVAVYLPPLQSGSARRLDALRGGRPTREIAPAPQWRIARPTGGILRRARLDRTEESRGRARDRFA